VVNRRLPAEPSSDSISVDLLPKEGRDLLDLLENNAEDSKVNTLLDKPVQKKKVKFDTE